MELNHLLMLLTPEVLLWMAIGSLVGVILGALPGMGPETGIALFLPLTYGMDPIVALSCLASIYVSGVFGGNFTAILMNTPGTPDSLFLCWDGYPMTKRGLGNKAIAISTLSAFVGGIVGAVALLFLSSIVSKFAVSLGPLEMFLITMIGISVIVSLTQKSMLKGFISAALGFAAACVGMDNFSGSQRFTFGLLELLDGLPLLPVVLGMFAISQMLILVVDGKERITEEDMDATCLSDESKKLNRITIKDIKAIAGPSIRAALIGTAIGIVPGAGGTTASGLSYQMEKSMDKHPEEYGQGSIRGIASISAAINGVVGGSLIPMITLGIPGCSTAALFLGALMIHGLAPGERLFTVYQDTIYPFMVAVLLAQLFLLFFGLLCGKYFSKLTKVQNSILIPCILLFTIVGAYTGRGMLFDVILMLVFGVIAYFWEKMDIPCSPFVLAFVLGANAESRLRRAIVLIESDFLKTMMRPVPLILLAINLFLIIWPIVSEIRAGKEKKHVENT